MSNHKILLAEPNELLRKVLTDRLRIDGFEVKAVVNGHIGKPDRTSASVNAFHSG